jgi:N-acetylglucosaminyl-diphospho-decaprenol L-rhamnosyltransferase
VEPEILSTVKLPNVQLGAQPDFSVILVCWNNKAYLKPCLDSLYEGNLHHQYEVVVVDNGSTDGSQAMLQEEYPEVQIIQNDYNVGLGKASNQGIEATHGRYVLLLNNDTLVNGPSLDAMVDFMDSHPEAGAVGGRLLNPDGSFQAANSKFPSLSEELLIATRIGSLFTPNYPDRNYPRDVSVVEWMGSACLLLRREALTQTGLLDETYFIYGDEADLQYRLRKAGWKGYYLPNVTTVHYGGRSMDRWKRRKMVYRGKMLFFRKNYGGFRAWLLRIMLALLSLGKMAVWAAAYLVPGKRDLSRKELTSNAEVIRLCWKLT